MTVAVPTYTEKTWAGDGATTAFPFATRVLEAGDLKVWLVENDTATLKSLTTHYTLSGLGSDGGVTVTFITAPASGQTVKVRRETKAKQTVNYADLGKVPGDTTETQLDRLAMAAQDNRDRLDQVEDLANAADLIADFDKRYLGAFAVDPTTDNDGGALLDGALYFSTTLGKFRVRYSGAWQDQDISLDDGDVSVPKLDATQKSGFSDLITGESFIDLKIHNDLIGNNNSGDRTKMQAALDNHPKEVRHVLPNDLYYFSAGGIVQEKTQDLLMGHSTLSVGGSGDAIRVAVQHPVGQTAVQAAVIYGDGRQIIYEGGRVFGPAGGYAGLNVNPAGGTTQASIFQMMIANGIYSGNLRAIRLGGGNGGPTETNGRETAFNTVWNCYLEIAGNDTSVDAASFAIEGGAADGNKLAFSKTAGSHGVGVHIDLTPGAFNDGVLFSSMVNRDGAVRIVDGSRVMVIGNQMEQFAGYGDNESAISTMVNVQALDRISHGGMWHWNNYGGGGNVDYNMVFQNSRFHVIDEEQFNVTNTADIWFRDETYGGTPVRNVNNVIGANNTPRGIRNTNLAAPTDASRRIKIQADTNSWHQRGYFRPSSQITFAGDSNAASLEFMIEPYGVLRYVGNLVVGPSVALNDEIMRLPPGCGPRESFLATVLASDGAEIRLNISSDRRIYLNTTITGSRTLHMQTLSYHVLWCLTTDYHPGE